jgi:lysozyme
MVNWEECYKIWREYEGLKLQAYPDPATGNEPWTIGYGHTGGLSGVKVKAGMSITKEQAEEHMRNDLAASYAALEGLVKVQLNPNQWAALVSFYGNLKTKTFLKSSVLKYINQGKLDEVPGRMALYRLGDGKVMRGLVRRRAAEGALWMKPYATVEQKPAEQIKEDVKATQGVQVEPAVTKKPWDWGAVGGFATLVAAVSGDIKKALGNFTEAFGVSPIVILLIAGAGFGLWTVYNKWKEK